MWERELLAPWNISRQVAEVTNNYQLLSGLISFFFIEEKFSSHRTIDYWDLRDTEKKLIKEARMLII